MLQRMLLGNRRLGLWTSKESRTNNNRKKEKIWIKTMQTRFKEKVVSTKEKSKQIPHQYQSRNATKVRWILEYRNDFKRYLSFAEGMFVF